MEAIVEIDSAFNRMITEDCGEPPKCLMPIVNK